jgi:hypothetical protein
MVLLCCGTKNPKIPGIFLATALASKGGAMQTFANLRHQASRCLRLAASCTDQDLADRFQATAQEFLAKAADAELRDESDRFWSPREPKREGPDSSS